MDHRPLIRGAGVVGPLTAAPAVHAQLRLRWRLASTSAKAQDLLTGAGDTFARRVTDLSRGRFSVAVQPAGEPYATSAEALEAVRSGSIEAVHVATHTLVANDECYALGSSLPFGLNARQLNAWLIDGNGLTLMREFHRANGLVNFPGGNVGAQMAGCSRREIKSAADVRGLRIAIDGLAATVWQRIGAEPQTVGPGLGPFRRDQNLWFRFAEAGFDDFMQAQRL